MYNPQGVAKGFFLGGGQNKLLKKALKKMLN